MFTIMYWLYYEHLGVKMIPKNSVAKAITELLGIPDWWDVQNPPRV